MIPVAVARWLAPAPDSGVADDIRRGKSPWADGIHLLWSVWIFITPLFDHGIKGYTPTWLLCTLGSYPVFLLLFAKIQLAPRRTVHWYAWAMAGLCFALLRWYPSGLSYFMYACVMLNHCRMRLRTQLVHLALLNAALLLLVWRIGYPLSILVIMPASVMVVSVIALVERINKEKDAALRLSQDEVRRLAVLAERERIGRDLHDLLGHTLSLVALKSDLAAKLVARDPQAARREIGEVSRVAREALSQVRSAVSGIRAAGIAAELASAKLLLECDGIDFRYDLDPDGMDLRALPPRVESALALTVREAVTNIQRHARAQSAQVAFASEAGEAVLRITDDGRGGAIVPGNGLGGMRERVESRGGRLRVDSTLRQGTCVEIMLPLPSGGDVVTAPEKAPVGAT